MSDRNFRGDLQKGVWVFGFVEVNEKSILILDCGYMRHQDINGVYHNEGT